MNNAKLQSICVAISAQVAIMHAGRKSWSKACGQWLVYGFEPKIGFGNAADLCGNVQRAWQKGGSIEEAVRDTLKPLFVKAGKWEEAA